MQKGHLMKNNSRKAKVNIAVGNPILETIPKMNLLEMQIFFMTLSKIKYEKDADGSWNKTLSSGEALIVTYDEMVNTFHLEDVRLRSAFRTALSNLRKTDIVIPVEDHISYMVANGRHDSSKPKLFNLTCGLINEFVMPRKGTVDKRFSVVLHNAMYPYVVQLKSSFTLTTLDEINDLKGSASIKLYLIAKAKAKGKKAISIPLTPDELRVCLLGPKGRNKYTATADFNRFVRITIDDINTNSPCNIELLISRWGKCISGYTLQVTFPKTSKKAIKEVATKEAEPIKEPKEEEENIMESTETLVRSKALEHIQKIKRTMRYGI